MGHHQQAETIAFLSDPHTFGGSEVARTTTSLSEIFLVGSDAYKLKRAIKRPYVDFSGIAKRRATCEREILLNRRTAPALYLDVVAVTREPHGLALNGDGEPVDHLVHMRRFDEAALFHNMAQNNDLNDRHIIDLADEIAAFHLSLPATSPLRLPGGGAKAMDRAIVDVAEAALSDGDPTLSDLITTAKQAWQTALAPLAARLDIRQRRGFVRQCHGDMHLANICLFDGKPMLFDCIEFNDAIACIDIAYDVAFPVMDLIAHGRTDMANLLMNRYLAITQDYHALALWPLFLASRAIVRGCVLALEAAQDPDKTPVAEHYLTLALDFLAPVPARLIAIGGRSGSGKSTLARHLAPMPPPPPGALWLRTDIIRKSLMGVHPEEKLGADGYSSAITKATYGRMLKIALRALKSGRPVMLDGVFLQPGERQAVADIAHLACAAFGGLWLDAPVDIRATRADARVGDPSDANSTIVHKQESYDAGEIDWPRIEVSGDLADSIKAAASHLNI